MRPQATKCDHICTLHNITKCYKIKSELGPKWENETNWDLNEKMKQIGTKMRKWNKLGPTEDLNGADINATLKTYPGGISETSIELAPLCWDSASCIHLFQSETEIYI